jgi:hypothetical protein
MKRTRQEIEFWKRNQIKKWRDPLYYCFITSTGDLGLFAVMRCYIPIDKIPPSYLLLHTHYPTINNINYFEIVWADQWKKR